MWWRLRIFDAERRCVCRQPLTIDEVVAAPLLQRSFAEAGQRGKIRDGKSMMASLTYLLLGLLLLLNVLARRRSARLRAAARAPWDRSVCGGDDRPAADHRAGLWASRSFGVSGRAVDAAWSAGTGAAHRLVDAAFAAPVADAQDHADSRWPAGSPTTRRSGTSLPFVKGEVSFWPYLSRR